MALTRTLISKVPPDQGDDLSLWPRVVDPIGCVQAHASIEAIPDPITVLQRPQAVMHRRLLAS